MTAVLLRRRLLLLPMFGLLVALAVTVLPACSMKSSPCEAAFEAAAAVPLDQVNDDEMLQTVRVCGGQEWLRQLEAHPQALGVTSISTQDEITVQALLCSKVERGESQMCDQWNEAVGDEAGATQPSSN